MSANTDLEGNRQMSQCILPTSECFNDAMDLLSQLLLEEQVPPQELRLVHGIGLLADNRPFAHAWVERGTACLFVGLFQGERVICQMERPAYYAHLRVQERTKYTMPQAALENRRTTHYGPWKPRYRALCGREGGAAWLTRS